jgi:hypothetical protein
LTGMPFACAFSRCHYPAAWSSPGDTKNRGRKYTVYRRTLEGDHGRDSCIQSAKTD